jgi:hypothetical protein
MITTAELKFNPTTTEEAAKLNLKKQVPPTLKLEENTGMYQSAI